MRQDLKKIVQQSNRKVRIEAKRAVELWIYSFADMYMILVFFFIAMAAMFAVKVKVAQKELETRKIGSLIPSAGRGPATAQSLLSIEFTKGSIELTEDAVENLKVLLPIVKNNKKAMIDVEGYSDASALRKDSGFSSNLELSSQRAVKVAEWFMNNGVSPARLRTYSFGNGQTWAASSSLVRTDRRVLVKFYTRGGS